MEYDLIISGVDHRRSGADAITADIAISDGRIKRIGDLSGATAKEHAGCLGQNRHPGFVDLHTHLDAQIGWDPMMSSSSYHGVTTAMIGNCGVTFAPCSPKNRRYLAELMESVEDIAADAIMDGLAMGLEQLRRISGFSASTATRPECGRFGRALGNSL